MLQLIKRFVREEAGLETVEYAIMTGLIVVAVIAIVASIGTKVHDKFVALDGAL